MLNKLTIHILLWLALFCYMASDNIQIAQAAENSNAYQATANRIRDHFDGHFMALNDKAKHQYATHMYRFTGEGYYAQYIIDHAIRISDRLNSYALNIRSDAWRALQSQKMMDELPLTRRGKVKKAALRNSADKPFALHLLSQIAQLSDYGIRHPAHEQFVEYLKQADLYELLMSSIFIKADAAQAASHVVWLNRLDIADWTESFNSAVQFTYPEQRDDKLDRHDFNNKLSGLAHIVLADSYYYQRPVSADKHAWIFNYFTQQKQRILTNAKEDILTEIGLSFLLVGAHNQPMLKTIKDKINATVDTNKNMILSLSGSDNLSVGERRNVSAYALLNWPQQLYQGPLLLEYQSLRARLPLMYQ